jgi:hypothetical protein
MLTYIAYPGALRPIPALCALSRRSTPYRYIHINIFQDTCVPPNTLCQNGHMSWQTHCVKTDTCRFRHTFLSKPYTDKAFIPANDNDDSIIRLAV